jgi:RHS repeat-associated protein
MNSRKHERATFTVLLRCACALALTPLPAAAQLAPTGSHYAARPSDTGFSGAVNSQGGYAVSLPLILPKARGNLPIPLRISYGGNRVGAAGLGWDVPLSFIRRDTTIAHHRPLGNLDADPPKDVIPRARIQLSLTLGGQRTDLVPNESGTAWVARRNDPQLEVREDGPGSMLMYDGAGRTYHFSSDGGPTGHPLEGGNLYLLHDIIDATGNTVYLDYALTSPVLAGDVIGLSIDLIGFRYNTGPATACTKDHIVLNYDGDLKPGYDAGPYSPLALSMLGSTWLARIHKLKSVDVRTRPTCEDSEVSLRKYELTYQTDPDTRRPQLQQVRMIGQEGTPERNLALPIASYHYGSVTGSTGRLIYRQSERIYPLPGTASSGSPESTFGISWTRQTLTDGPVITNMQNLIDINGDGRPDFVWGSWASLNKPYPGGNTYFSDPFLFGAPNSTGFRQVGRLNTPRQVFHRIGEDLNNPDHPEDRPPTYHEVWEATVDLNGDGRLDYITADEVGGYWVVYFNSPEPGLNFPYSFVRQLIPIGPIRQHLLDAGYGATIAKYGDNFLPLGRSATTRDTVYNQCWKWAADPNGTIRWILTIQGYFASGNNRCTPPQGQLGGRSDFDGFDQSEKTITEWELRDLNGDGYPDFVYNASPVTGIEPPNPPPDFPGHFVGEFFETQKLMVRDIAGSSDIRALINLTGNYLGFSWNVFSAPLTIEIGVTGDVGRPGGCGVSRWVSNIGHVGASVQQCGFEDVNGDGLVDRVTTFPKYAVYSVALGTGDLQALFAPVGTAGHPTFALPYPMARVESDLVPADNKNLGHYKPRACPDTFPEPPNGENPIGIPRFTYPIQRTAGLRDLNGDGIPDYILGDNSSGTTVWSVSFGTGTGFAPARPVDSPVGLELSIEKVGCWAEFADGGYNVSSGTPTGLYDIDGDGQPEVVSLVNHGLDVYKLNTTHQPDGTNVPNPPVSGRLISIDNGFGATDVITYRSAKEDASTGKEDASTGHDVPYPEIVVTKVATFIGTPDKSDSDQPILVAQYAYGGAEQIFDPAYDRFRFTGYRRTVQLKGASDPAPSTDGIAVLTDSYRLPAFEPAMDANARFGRYLKAGRISDITTISGNLGTDPWALLVTDITSDARRIGGIHYDWDSRLLPGGATGDEFCLDMVYPYDGPRSLQDKLYHPAASLDQCAQHGFEFKTNVRSYRGTPGTGSEFATEQVVRTSSAVQSVDDFARVTKISHLNDALRDDDDLCVEIAYATPAGPNERVLSAPASRALTNSCDPTLTPIIYAKETWEYDTPPGGTPALGTVSKGLITSHTVSRLNLETHASLGEIREFDASYDDRGNPVKITTRRDDAATRSVTFTYEPFGLAPISVRTNAKNADGTTLPLIKSTADPDPLTLNVLGTTDPNGTKTGTTFDGFGRVKFSTIEPPGGTEGLLSSTTYLGFAGEPGGRRIVKTVFADVVAPTNVSTATGRTRTVFLDALGRELRTEVALGADYAGKTLIVGQRTYDNLGRVVFKADPFLSIDSVETAYGTTHYFNTDGTPSCFIRGKGKQAFTSWTDEVNEVYPTCFARVFENNYEKKIVLDASSRLPGSPQQGVSRAEYLTAIGRPVQRVTFDSRLRALERLTFTHDMLGNVTSMTRYEDPKRATASEPGPGSNPVTTKWRYDSLGWIIERDQPANAPQYLTLNSWGEVTAVQWNDPTLSGGSDRRTITKFDALGRVTHAEDLTNNVTDPETIIDYAYDQPAAVSTPQLTVNPTFVLGKLAKATASTSAVSFSYDALGRVETEAFTDTQTPGSLFVERHGYHDDGSLEALHLLLPDTNFRDEKIDYSYDSAGRLRTVKYADGTGGVALPLLSFDNIDPFGRVREARIGLPAFNGPAVYSATYPNAGRRLLQTVKITSATGVASREISHLPEPGTLGSIAAYDPLGRERVRREIANGQGSASEVNISTYDTLGRLEATSTLDSGTGNVKPAWKFTYDPLGNLLTQTDLRSPVGAGTVTLSYEAQDRDRICSIAYGGTTPNPVCDVAYDGAGNITQERSRSAARKYRYFANGQIRTIADTNGTVAQFRYDAFGAVQRLDLTGSGPDTRRDRHFGPLIAVRDETDGNTSRPVITRTIPASGFSATRHGPAGPWIFSVGESRGNRFFIEAGDFVQDVSYQPYGDSTSSGQSPGFARYSNLQWNGGDALAALGLSQLGTRLYDPVIGRFLSRDPALAARSAATTNPYAFAMNDPMNGSDPTGLDSAPGDPDVHYDTGDSFFTDDWIRANGGEIYVVGQAPVIFSEYGNDPYLDQLGVEAQRAVDAELNKFNIIASRNLQPKAYTPVGFVVYARDLFGDKYKYEDCIADHTCDPADIVATSAQNAHAESEYAEAMHDMNRELHNPVSFEEDTFAMTKGPQSRPQSITEAHSWAALDAEALGGSRVFLVGPGGASTTRAIRFNGNQITYDTQAPAGAMVRQDMKAIQNMLGKRPADWLTGTHGGPDGQLDLFERFFYQDRQMGRNYSYNVRNVGDMSPQERLAYPEVPTVYHWCYSSACFVTPSGR